MTSFADNDQSPPALSFHAGDHLICAFHSDGSFEVGPAYTTADEAARKLLEAVGIYHAELIKEAKAKAEKETIKRCAELAFNRSSLEPDELADAIRALIPEGHCR